MPFEKKPRNPDVDQAVADAAAAHRQVADAERTRQAAIRTALDKGATLRELAAALDVGSPETIRRYRTEP